LRLRQKILQRSNIVILHGEINTGVPVHVLNLRIGTVLRQKFDELSNV